MHEWGILQKDYEQAFDIVCILLKHNVWLNIAVNEKEMKIVTSSIISKVTVPKPRMDPLVSINKF